VKVALNLLGLPSVRQGGTGFYCELLVRGLGAQADVQPNVLCTPQVAGELDGTGAELTSAGDRGGRARKTAELACSLRRPLRYADGYRRLPHDWPGNAALSHYPLSFVAGPDHRLPLVLTTLDLQHLAFPQFFRRRDRALRAIRWHRALRIADRVITSSDHARTTIVEHVGVPAEKIDVIPLAVSERFFGPSPDEAPHPEPFLFYPAPALPAKNHERLFAAFAAAAADEPDLRLVLSGPGGQDWAKLQSAAHRVGVADRVRFTGHLDLASLHAHYAYARALVFPSLYEGFGLPLAEALAVGCPIAASRSASVPEVVGDCGVLFDGNDVDDIARGIRELLDLPRDRFVEAGKRRAEGFRLDRMAEGTLGSYRRALAGGDP